MDRTAFPQGRIVDEEYARKKLQPLFARYRMDFRGIEATLKAKAIVLVIGSYSCGKSTLINELLGEEIQDTGQAPTDDSFTLITAHSGPGLEKIPGSTLVNDEHLPFGAFKRFGEKLLSHICIKRVPCPMPKNMAIIDSPGMLDAASEKDRGYDYLQVLGELAKIADLIVMMFDPHKPGTIKESYDTIRKTLPETAREDRILFVMSRIDECVDIKDLIKSYGTLCWNMSQMTGRKDIPRIYLTYSSSPRVVPPDKVPPGWPQERQELIDEIMQAPASRTSHILEDLERHVRELELVVEAVVGLIRTVRRTCMKTALWIVFPWFAFVFGYLLNPRIDAPWPFLANAFPRAEATAGTLILPTLLAAAPLLMSWLACRFLVFPWKRRSSEANTLNRLRTDTDDLRHSRYLKVEPKIRENLSVLRFKDLWFWRYRRHKKSRKAMRTFLATDMKRFYDRFIKVV